MKESILSRTDRQFEQFGNEIKYMILGDSHSQYGLDPDILGESFNFSSSSGSYINAYYKLKHILNNTDKTVKTVILPLDTHSFSSWYFEGPSNSWYWIKYVDFREVGRYRKKSLLYSVLKIQAYWAPYIGKRESFLRFIETKDKERKIINGFIPLDEEPDDMGTLDDKAREIIKHHFEGKKLYDESIMHYFWKALEICDNNNMRVVLIRFPVTQQYMNAALNWIDEKAEEELMRGIKIKYPKATVLDYRNIYFNNPQYFKDADHLNRQGADLFSQLIKGNI